MKSSQKTYRVVVVVVVVVFFATIYRREEKTKSQVPHSWADAKCTAFLKRIDLHWIIRLKCNKVQFLGAFATSKEFIHLNLHYLYLRARNIACAWQKPNAFEFECTFMVQRFINIQHVLLFLLDVLYGNANWFQSMDQTISTETKLKRSYHHYHYHAPQHCYCCGRKQLLIWLINLEHYAKSTIM